MTEQTYLFSEFREILTEFADLPTRRTSARFAAVTGDAATAPIPAAPKDPPAQAKAAAAGPREDATKEAPRPRRTPRPSASVVDAPAAVPNGVAPGRPWAAFRAFGIVAAIGILGITAKTFIGGSEITPPANPAPNPPVSTASVPTQPLPRERHAAPPNVAAVSPPAPAQPQVVSPPAAERVPVKAEPVAASSPATTVVPDRFLKFNSMLDTGTQLLNAGVPGKAYLQFKRTLDTIGEQANETADQRSAGLDTIRLRTERLLKIARQQCDNTADQTLVRNGCPSDPYQ